MVLPGDARVDASNDIWRRGAMLALYAGDPNSNQACYFSNVRAWEAVGVRRLIFHLSTPGHSHPHPQSLGLFNPPHNPWACRRTATRQTLLLVAPGAA